MVDILIRGVDEQLDRTLKQRAAMHGRTREAEVKAILQVAISMPAKKRSLAEALLDIPTIDDDVDDLFSRPGSPARSTD